MGFGSHFRGWCFGIQLFIPIVGHTLVVEAVQIDSSQGELLYAEIPFSHALSAPLQVSIAGSGESLSFGMPPIESAVATDFNTYVRQNQQGQGVIVITSTRPIQNPNINLVLKIVDGQQTRLQQIRSRLPNRADRLKAHLTDTRLTPQQLSAAVALNLPSVSPAASVPPKDSQEQQVQISTQTPPSLKPAKTLSAATSVTMTPPTALSTPATSLSAVQPNHHAVAASIDTTHPTDPLQPTTTQANPSAAGETTLASDPVSPAAPPSPNLVAAATTTPAELEPAVAEPSPEKKTTAAPHQATILPDKTLARSSHTVRANESLWSIAAQLAQQQDRPISQIMQQIQTDNPVMQTILNRVPFWHSLSNIPFRPNPDAAKLCAAQLNLQPNQSRHASRPVAPIKHI
jgi:pilus assembly protein FimV